MTNTGEKSKTATRLSVQGRLTRQPVDPAAWVAVLLDHNVDQPAVLATVPILADGDYTFDIDVPAEYLEEHRKARLDLQVEIRVEERVIGRSSIAFDAPWLCELDVNEVSGFDQRLTNFEETMRHVTACTPRSLHLLGAPALSYLSRKTGLELAEIQGAAAASRLANLDVGKGTARIASLLPEQAYALLRAGFPAEPERLFRTAPATVLATWRRAIADHIIPAASEAELEAARQSYIALAAAHMLDGEGATLRPMLAPVLPGAARQQRFARLIVEHGGAGTGFDDAVEAAFGAAVARRLHRLGSILRLIDGDVPLATALLAAERRLIGTVDLVDRGYAEPGRWASLPDGVAPGAERAAALADRLRQAHPIPALAHRLRHGLPGFGVHAAPVADFLRHHADAFDLGAEPVEAYLRRTGHAAPPPPVLAQLKRLQRVRRLVDDDAALPALFGAGFDSALRIARRPPSAFQAALPGVAPTAARRIHARAQRVHSTVLNAASAYVMARRAATAGGPAALIQPNPVQPMDTTGLLTGPTLETLFGSLDTFACTDCASILGPAAYLADLLAFLDLAPQGTGTALDVLLGRRPDLQELALTCANADTALPYIDVVVETLEYLVAHGGAIDGYDGYDTPGTLDAAELLASPQNVLLAAYPVLRTTMFPPPLPYNRTLELLRSHVQRLGFALPDMMQALRASDALVGATGSYGWTDILIERLALSRDEMRLFTDPTLQLGDLYGLSDPDPLGLLQAMTVQDLSRRLGTSYDDLFAMLETRFINPAVALILQVQQLQTSFQAISDLNATAGTPNSTAAAFLAGLPIGIDATRYGGTTSADLAAIVTWLTTPAVFQAIMGLITVGSLGDPSTAQPADMQLLYADPTLPTRELGELDWLKLIRFIRLRAKLTPLLGADTIGQTDAILTALFPAEDLPAGTDPAADRRALDAGFATLLLRAGSLFDGMGRLGLGADAGLAQMLALWAPIGTAGPGALYDRMFLSPALLKVEAAVQSIVLYAVAPGDTIAIGFDGIAISYLALAQDTPDSVAIALAAAVNATETIDTVYSLPVNQIVAATTNGPTILLQLLGTDSEPVISCSVQPDLGWSAECQPVWRGAGIITLDGDGVLGATITTTYDKVDIPLVVTDIDPEALATDLASALSGAWQSWPPGQRPRHFIFGTSVGQVVVVTTRWSAEGFPVAELTVENTAASPVLTATAAGDDTWLVVIKGEPPAGQVLTIAIAGETIPVPVVPGATAASLAADLVTAMANDTTLGGMLVVAAYGGTVTITSTAPIDSPTLFMLSSICAISQQAPPFARDAFGDVLTNPSLFLMDFVPLLCAACNLTGAELASIAGALGYDGSTPLSLQAISEVFRRGWLAHALGISVAELLALIALPALDPFPMPDPAAAPPMQPPSTRAIALVQGLLGAGLTVSQALYLVFDQDLAGSSAPPLSDILGLAVTLRADFAAVEAQFALQSDPDGTIAQSLMALVYGSTVADFFFGLLNASVVSAVPYATVPGATVPEAVIDAAAGRLAFDPLHQTLTFAGVLDAATLAAIAIAAAAMPAGFASALAALAASNAQAIQPFFSAHRELSGWYADYAASTAPLPDRRTALLAAMLPALRQSRKQEQAIASLAALLDLDQVSATALLMDSSALHAQGAPAEPAVTDLVALEPGGLSATLDSGTLLPCVPNLAYLQTATVGGIVTTGDQLVTTIAGVTLTYSVAETDTSPAVLAASLAAAINADVADPASGQPGLAQAVVAQAAGPVVQLAGRDPAGAQDLFSLACSTQAGAATTYAAGTQWPGDGTWSGYLVAPQDGTCDISVTTDKDATGTLQVGAASVTIAGSSQLAVTLSAGAPVPVSLEVSGASTTMVVRWQSAGAGWSAIPAVALYPAQAIATLQATYTRVLKAGALGTLLSLAPAEIVRGDGTPGCAQWLNQTGAGTTPDPATKSMLTGVLQGLLDFARIKAALSPNDGRLLAAVQAGQPGPLVALTGWKQSSLDAILAQFFGAPPIDYGALATTTGLARVFDAYAYATSCRVEPSVLLAAVTNDPVTTGVSNLQASLRAQYAEADWLTIVTPLNNTMRMQQRDALVACVGQQVQVIMRVADDAPAGATMVQVFALGTATVGMMVTGAAVAPGTTIVGLLGGPGILVLSQGLAADVAIGDSLFALRSAILGTSVPDGLYTMLLMDPLTQPAVQTSRIRLALSSVQLFVERVLRGLEPGVTLGPDLTAQWPAMGRYRVWQANREIFLWPENWLYPELRDDASPLFQDTMAALLQTDITDDAAEGAYIDYLTGLEQIAKLEPCGMYYVDGDDVTPATTYIVARSPGAHRKHFTRTVLPTGWTPWQEVKIDCDDMPLTPIVWNGRLFLFWLKLIKQGNPATMDIVPGHDPSATVTSITVDNLQSYAANGTAVVNTQAVLCWVEQVNGKWTATKTSDVKNPITIASGADIEAQRATIRLLPVSTSWILPLNIWAGFPSRAPDVSSLADALILVVAPAGQAQLNPGFVLHNTHSLPVPIDSIQFPVQSIVFPFQFGTVTLRDILIAIAPSFRAFPDATQYRAGTIVGSAMSPEFSLTASVPAAFDTTPAAPTFSLFQRSWTGRIIDAQPGTAEPALTPFLYEDPQNLLYFTPTEQGHRALYGVIWPSLRDPPVTNPTQLRPNSSQRGASR